MVWTDTIELTIYDYGRTNALSKSHYFTTENPQTLSIENLVITPPLGSGKVNMRLAADSDLKSPD